LFPFYAFHVDLATFVVTDVTANVTIPFANGDNTWDNGWGMFLTNKPF